MNPEAELSVLFVGEAQGRRINREHRGVDASTDVISFPQRELGEDWPEEGPLLMGDLVLCLPVVERQAREEGLRVDDEIAILLVHGVLHLLGFDHQISAQAQTMVEHEMSILAALGRVPEDALVGRFFENADAP